MSALMLRWKPVCAVVRRVATIALVALALRSTGFA